MKPLYVSLGVLAISLTLAAQAPGPSGPDGPSFEGVAIRLNNSGRGGSHDVEREGRDTMTNASASRLLDSIEHPTLD
jgi:hypothetical protein